MNGKNRWRTGRGYLYSDNNPDILFNSGYQDYVTVVTFTVWQEIGLDVDYLREDDHIIWTKIDTDPSKVMPDMHGRTTGLDEDKSLLIDIWRIATAGINAGAQNMASIESHSAVPKIEDYYINIPNEYQRGIWATGAEIGYAFGLKLTWYLLMNSLSTYPQDVLIEEGVSNLFDDVIEEIKKNKDFHNGIDKFLQDKMNSFSKTDVGTINIEPGSSLDLYAALHGCHTWLSGERNEDGTWNLEVEMTDTYDFTDLVKFWEKDGFFNKAGWAANDLAYFSQESGAITPFDVKIHFTMKNYGVEKK